MEPSKTVSLMAALPQATVLAFDICDEPWLRPMGRLGLCPENFPFDDLPMPSPYQTLSAVHQHSILLPNKAMEAATKVGCAAESIVTEMQTTTVTEQNTWTTELIKTVTVTIPAERAAEAADEIEVTPQLLQNVPTTPQFGAKWPPAAYILAIFLIISMMYCFRQLFRASSEKRSLHRNSKHVDKACQVELEPRDCSIVTTHCEEAGDKEQPPSSTAHEEESDKAEQDNSTYTFPPNSPIDLKEFIVPRGEETTETDTVQAGWKPNQQAGITSKRLSVMQGEWLPLITLPEQDQIKHEEDEIEAGSAAAIDADDTPDANATGDATDPTDSDENENKEPAEAENNIAGEVTDNPPATAEPGDETDNLLSTEV